MKVNITLILFVLLSNLAFSSAKTDSLLVVLKSELSKQKQYDQVKLIQINKLKKRLQHTPKADYTAQYNICTELYEAYKVYQFDSAYVYTQKLFKLSELSKDDSKKYKSSIKLSFILMSAGMFTEAFECINKIDTRLLDDDSKLEYYAFKSRAYSDLSDYNNDKYYSANDNQLSVRYLDSVIALSKPESFNRLFYMGEKQFRTRQFEYPSIHYLNLLNHFNITEHQRAMVATNLSFFYRGDQHIDDRIYLLATGAINDIRSSTKETLAIFRLGEELYQDGDVKDAYLFIQQAMNNAEYYGARLRKIKIGAVLPVVAAQQLIIIEKERNRFLIYLLSIGTLAIMVTLISFVIFNQLKRLKTKEKIIEEKNIQLGKINDKLIENTRIKEEYIGYFFNVVSGYILKIEKIKRNVERKIPAKKYDEILFSVSEINIKKEREALFYTFDHIFLKIFPNFIIEFNALLKKEDQIWPKDHEVLNTDLRIFALMRLGISDNETVANILEYSVNTIYVYKMRIKAKSIIPGDQFDHSIMTIKSS